MTLKRLCNTTSHQSASYNVQTLFELKEHLPLALFELLSFFPLHKAGLPDFLEYLKGLNAEGEEDRFSIHLQNVLRDLHECQDSIGQLSDTSGSVNPIVILDALRKDQKYIAGEQQDSHEAFNFIVSVLERESQKNKGAPAILMRDKYKDLLTASQLMNSSRGIFDSNKQTWESEGDFKNPFESLITYNDRCIQCGKYKAKVNQATFCYSLPLEASTSTMEECFSKHFSTEVIDDVYCDMCTLKEVHKKITDTPLQYFPAAMKMGIAGENDYFLHETHFESQEMKEFLSKVGVSRMATTVERRLYIVQSPQIMVLHLNRAIFDTSTGMSRKLGQIVHFPFAFRLDSSSTDEDDLTTHMRIIDTGTSTGPGAYPQSFYSLVAVLVHTASASVHYGHYYSCILDSKGRWLGVSDNSVWMMTLDQVRSAPAFLLFYEKKQGSNVYMQHEWKETLKN